MKNEIKLALYTGVLVFSASALIGWKSSPAPVSESSPEKLSSRTTQTNSSSQLMRNVRSQRTESNRMRSAIQMARTLPSSEIREWLNQGKFSLRSGYALTLFEKIAFERWAKEEPEDFLIWAGRNNPGQFATYINDIVDTRPEVIRGALASMDAGGGHDQILRLVAKKAPDLALQEVQNLLASPVPFRTQLSQTFNTLVESYPVELKGPLRQGLEQAVVSYDLKHNPDAAFEYLFNTPKGFDYVFGHDSYNLQNRVSQEDLFKRLADIPPEWRNKIARSPYRLFEGFKSFEQFADFNWTDMGFTADQISKIQNNFFQSRIQSKPEEILSVIDQYEFSASEKRSILRAAFYRSRSEEDIARFSSILNSAEDRALFDDLASENRSRTVTSSNAPKIESPEQLINALPDRNISSLATNMRQWTKEQKDQFVETYRSLEGPDKDYLSSLAIGSRSRVPLEMKSEAYAHLLTLPEDHEYSEWRTQGNGNFAVEAVSQHALDLMNSDPLQATAWLASLPEGPVRMMAQGNLALNWQNYDPKAVENWLSSLPADNQTEIKEFMKSNK